MATVWRGIGVVCTLVLLASCSSRKSAQVPLAPQTPAFEKVYQDGRLAFKERRYDEAAAQFARVVAADPEYLKARLNWAAALSYLNKPGEAVVQCQYVLARDPTNAEAYYQWGAVLARMGQHQEAVEKYDLALALKPMAELPIRRWIGNSNGLLAPPPSPTGRPAALAAPPAPPARCGRPAGAARRTAERGLDKRLGMG